MTFFKKLIAGFAMVVTMGAVAQAGGNVGTLVAPVVVTNDSGFYLGAGLGYADTTFKVTDCDISLDGNNLNGTVLAGYNFNKYVAVEGRYTWLVEEGFGAIGYGRGANIDVKGDSWALFVKPMYPITDTVTVYGLLGYGQTSFTSYEDIMTNEGSYEYGIGAKFAVTNSVEVFGDWTKVYDDNYDIDNVNINSDTGNFIVGVNYKF